MNNTGPCTESMVQRKTLWSSKERDLCRYSQERILGESRIVVVVFYKLNKKRGIFWLRKVECLKAEMNRHIERVAEIAGRSRGRA